MEAEQLSAQEREEHDKREREFVAEMEAEWNAPAGWFNGLTDEQRKGLCGLMYGTPLPGPVWKLRMHLHELLVEVQRVNDLRLARAYDRVAREAGSRLACDTSEAEEGP